MGYNLNEMLSKYVRPQNEWSSVDKAIYSNETDPVKQKELRFEALKFAFNWHFYQNRVYFNYCKMMGVSPDDIKTEDDLLKIPLVSDSNFKKYPSDIKLFPAYFKDTCSIPVNFGDVPKEAFKDYDSFFKYADKLGYHITFSSSTSGTFSFVLRDKITLDRISYVSIRSILDRMPFTDVETLTPYSPDKVRIIGSLPNGQGSNYFMTTIYNPIMGSGKIYPDVRWGIKIPITTKIMRIQSGHAKKSEKILSTLSKVALPYMLWHTLIKELEKAQKEVPTTVLVFLPEFLSIFMDEMERKNISFDFSSDKTDFYKGLLITGGGFKAAKKVLDREEIMERVEKNFNIPREVQFDFYSANELNFPAIECEKLKKHLPFYVKGFAIDDNGEILPPGERGRLAILDPISNSYPSFILTGDSAIVDNECDCGLNTQAISNISRSNPTDDKGCGPAFSKLISGN